MSPSTIPIPLAVPTYPARPLHGGRFNLIPRTSLDLWSPKLNGWRTLVHTPYPGKMFNRQGEPLTIADEFRGALELLWTVGQSGSDFEWLDCECLESRHNLGRGTLVILDYIPDSPDAAQRYADAADRYARLEAAAIRHEWLRLQIGDKPAEHTVYLLQQNLLRQSDPTSGRILLAQWLEMQQLNKQWGCEFYEGFVAKRANSPYPLQTRDPRSESTNWMKFRFVN